MDLLPKVERYYKFGKVKFAKDYYIKFYLFFFSKVTDMLHECVSDFIGELSIEQAEDIKHETCQFHDGKTFAANCTTCDQLVCLKCIVSTHKGHTFQDLSELLEANVDIINQIKKETLEKQWLVYLQKERENAQTGVDKIREHNEQTKTKIQNTYLACMEKIKRLKDMLLAALELDVSKAEERLALVQGKNNAVLTDLETIKNVLSMGSACEVIQLSLRLQSKYLQNSPTCLNENIISARKSKFLHRLKDFNVLGDNLVVPQLDVYGVYQTNLGLLSTIKNLFEDETWVAGIQSPVTYRFHVPTRKHSRAIKYKVKKAFVYSVAFTSGNTSVLMTFVNVHEIRAFNIQRMDEEGVLFTDTRRLFPLGIDVSLNGDVFACASAQYSNKMTQDTERGVLRISKTGKVLNFFVSDSESFLFSYPSCLTENVDGTVCVIDRKSNFSGRMVAINNLGKKLFTYERPSYLSPRDEMDLKYITHDSVGNIFMSDSCNNRVHMISKSGEFLVFVIGPDEIISINLPLALHADLYGNLWIGCLSESSDKTCQVMKVRMTYK